MFHLGFARPRFFTPTWLALGSETLKRFCFYYQHAWYCPD
jgi:hypothetical protein